MKNLRILNSWNLISLLVFISCSGDGEFRDDTADPNLEILGVWNYPVIIGLSCMDNNIISEPVSISLTLANPNNVLEYELEISLKNSQIVDNGIFSVSFEQEMEVRGPFGRVELYEGKLILQSSNLNTEYDIELHNRDVSANDRLKIISFMANSNNIGDICFLKN